MQCTNMAIRSSSHLVLDALKMTTFTEAATCCTTPAYEQQMCSLCSACDTLQRMLVTVLLLLLCWYVLTVQGVSHARDSTCSVSTVVPAD
jgi:hypothetical protein